MLSRLQVRTSVKDIIAKVLRNSSMKIKFYSLDCRCLFDELKDAEMYRIYIVYGVQNYMNYSKRSNHCSI